MKDLTKKLSTVQALAPVVADATKTSSAIDMDGANSLLICFECGVPGDTLSATVKFTPSLTESDNNSDYTAVDAADIVGTLAAVASGTAASRQVVGYKGSKRYVKAVITAAGTHTTGTPWSVTAIKGDLQLM